MLHFVYGGAHQGKWAFVKEQLLKEKTCYLDGHDVPLDLAWPEDCDSLAFNAIHHWVRRMLLVERDPAPIFTEFLKQAGARDVVLICDDMSAGLIPTNAFDRQFRAQVGKLSQLMTQRAVRVTRLVAGVPIPLKDNREKGT